MLEWTLRIVSGLFLVTLLAAAGLAAIVIAGPLVFLWWAMFGRSDLSDLIR